LGHLTRKTRPRYDL